MRTLFSRKTIRQHTTCQQDKTGRWYRRGGTTILLSLFAWLTNPVTAEAAKWYSAEFSADIVHTDPRTPQNKLRSTFYAGKDRFRIEGVYQGKRTAMIVHLSEHKMWTLFPENKTYYAGPGRVPVPPTPDIERLPGDRESPCQQDKATSCRRIGSETLHGVTMEKWEITLQGPPPAARGGKMPQSMTRKVTLWADPSRHIIARQQPEGGPAIDRLLVAMEKINGRQTEKWTFVQGGKGQTQKHFRWVDAKLRLPVKEERGGKVIMELMNIQEKAQPADLFTIPAGFKKIQPPFPFQRQGGPGQGQPPHAAPPGQLQYH